MSWSRVINQSRVKNILINSLERKRLAHAYLFSGPEGSGKYAVAIELARAVNCEEGHVDGCGVCKSCLKYDTLHHPNVKLIFPLPVGRNEKSDDNPLEKLLQEEIEIIHDQLNLKAKNPYHPIVIPKANTIKLNSIREIRRTSSLSAFDKGKKVFIIIDAENMNDEASNAILKTLEEPHEDTLLILTSSKPDSLLPTIKSRCQHIRFDPLSDEVIIKALCENKGMNIEEATAIAQLSNGSYTRALQYVDAALFDTQKLAIEFLRTLMFKSREALLNEIGKITSDCEKAEIRDILQLMQQWLHEVMLFQQGVGNKSAGRTDESQKKFIASYPNWNYSSICKSFEHAISLLDKNVYIPLILINLSNELKEHVSAPSTVHS